MRLFSPEYAKALPVRNTGKAWKNGLAFLALIHSHDPAAVPGWDAARAGGARENLEAAFEAARTALGVEPLLDVEDLLDFERPDQRSVLTYLLVLKKAIVEAEMGGGG